MKANDKIRQKIILNQFKLTFLKQNNISCPSSCPKMKMTQFTTHRHKEYSRLFILDRLHIQDILLVSPENLPGTKNLSLNAENSVEINTRNVYKQGHLSYDKKR